MDDLTSRSRTYYRDVVRQWGRLALEQGNQISHGDYNWNPAEAVLPYSRVKITGEDFPIYQQAGFQIKSTNLEKSWYLTAAHDYISLKMMWNAGLDWHDLLREFCVKAYGSDAAPIMESYYLDVAQRQSESSHEAGSFFAIPLIYDMAFVTEQEQRFAAATAAAGTEIERKRIDAARYPVLALKQFLAMRSAYATFDFKAARVAFGHATNDLEAITSRNIHFENTSGKRYFSGYGRYLDAACRYSEGAYAIEYAIPNRLKTMIDINNLGAQHRFWGSQMDDSSHLTTETFLSTWDAQGLSGFQQGSAWYRIHFTLNEKAARPGGYGLFVGGAENRVAIWCNDTFIGRSGTGLRSPTLFDITDAVRPGQENLVVIQATRHGISELFVGGLTMPSFVFSGPRVEQAKDTEPAFRILPGGTVELVKPGEMAD